MLRITINLHLTDHQRF